MAASTNERGSQRVRFFDWLIKEINSGKYDGLCWLDENCTTFRIPWKHNARKSLEAKDYKIFQAWALVSGKYVEDFPDPAKWKTNFRCALKSTRRFELVSESKDPDPHHVYRICNTANPPADAAVLSSKHQLELTSSLQTGSGLQSAMDLRVSAQKLIGETASFQDSQKKPKEPAQGSSDLRNDTEDEQLHISTYNDGLPTRSQPVHQIQEINVVFETLSLGNPASALNGNASETFYQCSDTIQWPMHQLPVDKRPSPNLDEIEQVAWVPNPLGGPDNPSGSAAAYESNQSYIIPQIDQNGCLSLGNGGLNEPVENHYTMWPTQAKPNGHSQSATIHPLQHIQQNPPGTNQFNLGDTPYNSFIERVFLNEEAQGCEAEMNNPSRNSCWLPMNEAAVAEQDMFVSPTVSPAEQPFLLNPLNIGLFPLNLEVSIYYKGKLMDERHIEASTCKFVSDNLDFYTSESKDAQIVRFPNPETLPDQKQVKHTLTLLESASLLLYLNNGKICARRLGRCKVFVAFSKQLENMDQHPQSQLLPRNEETEIFNYGKFLKELMDFRDNRCGSSPDYTIYLCFGQCFSSNKSKESRLILVKLVPKFCRSLHEQAQKDGASSLSENMSLQISNSLHEMMEELLSFYNMEETY